MITVTIKFCVAHVHEIMCSRKNQILFIHISRGERSKRVSVREISHNSIEGMTSMLLAYGKLSASLIRLFYAIARSTVNYPSTRPRALYISVNQNQYYINEYRYVRRSVGSSYDVYYRHYARTPLHNATMSMDYPRSGKYVLAINVKQSLIKL